MYECNRNCDFFHANATRMKREKKIAQNFFSADDDVVEHEKKHEEKYQLNRKTN